MLYFLLTPFGFALMLVFISLWLFKRWPKFARLTLLLSLIVLYVFSTRFIAYHLGVLVAGQNYKQYPALSLTNLPKLDVKTTAIVVLGYGRYTLAPSYGGKDIISSAGLVRTRYAARMYKKTQIPILLTGNSGGGGNIVSEAELMQEVLNEDFGIKDNIWLETKSSSTFENAKFSAKILQKKNIKTIILVTHRGHMPRALKVFEKHPFKIIPAPLGRPWEEFIWKRAAFVPSAGMLATSSAYLHQLLAMAYYQLSGKF